MRTSDMAFDQHSGDLTAGANGVRQDFEAEAEVVGRCTQAMEAAMSADPVWANALDATDILVCPRDELIALLRSAPNAFAAGMIYGVFTMRQEVAMMTERPFE